MELKNSRKVLYNIKCNWEIQIKKKNGEPRRGGGRGSTLCCSITQSRIEPSPYITNKVRQTIEISK
jgi:hypothetical protein